MGHSRRSIVPLAVGLLLAGLRAAAAGQSAAPELVLRLLNDPASLRHQSVLRSLRSVDQESYAPVMRTICRDSSQDWDVRARAVTLLDLERDGAAFSAFAEDFEPLEVAAGHMGAEAFNILAVYVDSIPSDGGPVAPLLFPGEGMAGVDPVLRALAGSDVHDYLHLLFDRGNQFRPATIAALAETDDQLTRQLLCWYVGQRRLPAMESFLLDQIESSRSSSYGSKVDRVFLAVFTLGIGEIIRSSVPKPGWLGDDCTPKGLALQSLGQLLPPGQPLADSRWVDRLLAAAAANAPGKDRGEWQLAVDILFFLHEHREPLEGRADSALAALARQPIRKRGPLQPFVASESICRAAALRFPQLSDQEKAAVWDVADKTLSAAYIPAVVRALPDAERQAALEGRLLGLGEQAARDNLRVVRCWGADIETPGDWALLVAELGLRAAVPHVEGVLDTSWTDEAISALVVFGEPGAPALARFLRSEAAPRLSSPLKVEAIRACAEHLPPSQWLSLKQHLRSDRYLSEALENLGREIPLQPVEDPL